ncbi:MAG: hypothetical protein LUE17_01445 [Planctomycetaceae bacterium]|nr:hypothetical protein [Planctomycetaceae bacterium]
MDSLPDRFLPATAGHARDLAGNLSTDHRRELAATGGLSPRAALELSVAHSVEAYTYVDPAGVPVFMMGVEAASPLTGAALVWMLASDAAGSRPRGILRAARWGLARAFAVTGAASLEQYIPAWYRTGLRFVRRLGFRIRPAQADGRDGARLCRAILTARKESRQWDR